jgi:hypothetical protein
VTILLRFIFGVVLAGSLVVWAGLPSVGGVVLVAAVGVLAAIWGDKFLLGFMSLMRYFR